MLSCWKIIYFVFKYFLIVESDPPTQDMCLTTTIIKINFAQAKMKNQNLNIITITSINKQNITTTIISGG
jgi:hypothetical protein